MLPVLDLIALGILTLVPASSAHVAVALPAIWLALLLGWRGVWLATLTSVLAYAVPLQLAGRLMTLGSSAGGEELSALLEPMVMVLITASVVALSAQVWSLRTTELASSAERLQRALVESTEHRRLAETIVSSVDIGLAAVDSRGNYTLMNPRQRSILAAVYPTAEDLRQRRGFVYAEDGRTRLTLDQLPRERIAAGETIREEVIWVGAESAGRRAISVSSAQYHDDHGRVIGTVLACHDITELVMASRVKDDFVATVSHELRTPLTSIIGYLEMVLEEVDDLPGEARAYLGTVQRNAHRLHRLVDDLLFSALQAGELALDRTMVQVGDLFSASSTIASEQACAAGLQLRHVPGPGTDLHVWGDGERLSQVFDNLFSNAVKFTAAGGVVTSGVRRDEEHVVLWVSDTGRGIPEDEVEVVFEKFFRNQGVQNDAVPGVGLGLTLARAIVEAHGGQICVTSVLGEGSTFEVRLPVANGRVLTAAS